MAATTIDQDDWNTLLADLETALSESIARDGQTTITADLPMNSKKFTGLAAGSSAGHSVQYEQVPKLVTDNIFVSTTADATQGPIIDLHRNSASPADDDLTGTLRFSGEDDGSNKTTFAEILAKILDVTDATEDGQLILRTMQAGTLTDAFHVALGMFAEGNTDPGVGKIDADDLLVSGTSVMLQGLHTIWVPATSMSPTVSNGCAALALVETTAGRPDMSVLDFDASADEHAQFSVAFPKSWNLGTVTAQFFWTSTAADTDGVSWAIQGLAVPDNSTIDAAYGTAIVVDDANQGAAEELLVSAVTGAITIGGTPADDDLCWFRVFRDVSDANDTATEDARLLGVKFFYTIDAGNDA